MVDFQGQPERRDRFFGEAPLLVPGDDLTERRLRLVLAACADVDRGDPYVDVDILRIRGQDLFVLADGLPDPALRAVLLRLAENLAAVLGGGGARELHCAGFP